MRDIDEFKDCLDFILSGEGSLIVYGSETRLGKGNYHIKFEGDKVHIEKESLSVSVKASKNVFEYENNWFLSLEVSNNVHYLFKTKPGKVYGLR